MTLDPRLIGSYAAAIIFNIVFPLVVGFYIHRRYQVRWRFFLYGALVFFLSQIVLRIPITIAVQYFAGAALQSPTNMLVWLVVLAVSAGIFEEVGRWLGYRFLIKHDRTWRVGLMYGAGHGGLESMLLVGGAGLLTLVNIFALANINVATAQLPAAQLAAVQQAQQQIAGLAWWLPLLGAYERFVTIFFQIALSILVLQVFLRSSWLWLFAAILLHAVVDLGAVLLAQQVGPVWTEVALTLLLPLSLFIIIYFRPSEIPAIDVVAPHPA